MFGSKQKTREKLAAAITEALGGAAWLESVTVDDAGKALLVIRADEGGADVAEHRCIEAENYAGRVPGISSVRSVVTAERAAASPRQHDHGRDHVHAHGPANVPLTPSPRRVTKGRGSPMKRSVRVRLPRLRR